jgi:hypothetical protein
MAVSTLLLFLATLGLYLATRDLVHDADGNAKRQLRAYVSAKPIAPGLINFTPSMTAEVEISYSNSGLTPAIELTSRALLYFRPYPLPENVEADVPPAKENGSVSTLHPRDTELGVLLKREVDPQMFIGNAAGIVKFYALGRIDYKDINGSPHWTRFCYYFIGTPPNLNHWQACSRNNDTDKN